MSRNNDGSLNLADLAPAKSVEWFTPERILECVREYYGGPIPLDPATTKRNPTKATKFFTKTDNGLILPWSKKGTFVNPPYGKVIRDWVAKIHAEAAKGRVIIALLPCGARFSTRYWQEHALNERLTASCFVRGRVQFVDQHGNPIRGKDGKKKGNPYDSMLYGYNVNAARFSVYFGELGRVFKLEAVA